MTIPNPLVSQRSLNIALSRPLPKYLTRNEVHAVLAYARANPRDHLFLNLLWQTGARVSELLELRPSDIDPYIKTIKLTTLKVKNKPVRVIPVQAELIKEIFDYLEKNPTNDRIFNFSRQNAHLVVQHYCKRAGIDSKRSHPHTFRHSFAINAILQGTPVMVVQTWLGHQALQSTLIYTKILASDTLHLIDNIQF